MSQLLCSWRLFFQHLTKSFVPPESSRQFTSTVPQVELQNCRIPLSPGFKQLTPFLFVILNGSKHAYMCVRSALMSTWSRGDGGWSQHSEYLKNN